MAEQAPDVVQQFEVLALELLAQSAVELFSSYECDVAVTDVAMPNTNEACISLGAAIGFTGECVRGVLAIGLDEKLTERINPVPNGNSNDAHQDWMGELANQLLGRLKNKLLSYNVELALSTPVVVRGNQLRFGTTQRGASHLRFTHEGDFADVWWDAEVDPALEISESEAPDVQLEGEMVLF